VRHSDVPDVTSPSRLLLVDDHPVVLFGLRLLFRDHPRFRLVAEAADAAQARALTEAHRPDFVVSDLAMGERDGSALIEDLVAIHPPVQILVYSSHDEAAQARAALAAGARGYLCKTEGLEAVAAALDRIAAGAVVVGHALQARLVRRAEQDRATAGLSGREREVLARIGRAESLQTIALDLGLSVKTIGTYRERLKIKLGLDSLRDLERYAEDVHAGRAGA
jgi:two-component system, NarL family, response regulator NreC